MRILKKEVSSDPDTTEAAAQDRPAAAPAVSAAPVAQEAAPQPPRPDVP
ncbi:hypothetical protein [Leucobacter muris]